MNACDGEEKFVQGGAVLRFSITSESALCALSARDLTW